MIDLHCHVLDETACGPESLDQSLEMCRAAAAAGVRVLVATPDWGAGAGLSPLSVEECRQKAERLQQAMGGALRVQLGFALQFSPGLPDVVDRHGSQLALGGKSHLLVSLPVNLPAEVEEVWAHLESRGFLPVVAHPECHPALRRDPARLEAWVSRGAVLQVDAGSLTGAHGRLVQQTAFEYLSRFKRDVVVASNARRGRPNMLGNARTALTRRLGKAAALRYLRQTPTTILCGPVADECAGPESLVSRLADRLRSRMSLGLQRGVS